MALHAIRAEPVEVQIEVIEIVSPSASSAAWEMSRSVRRTTLEWLWSGQQAKEALAAVQRFGKPLDPDLERFLKPQRTLIEQLDIDSLSHDNRLLIGKKLAEFGDTRVGVDVKFGLPRIVWIDIPGGQVRLDRVDHVFEVKPFRIAKYLVTNAQFESFLNAEDGCQNEEWWRDIEQGIEAVQPRWQEANCPREMVSWYEAVAFCRWLSAKTGTSIRLPTEWEWKQAATGGDLKREYPWEGGWDRSRCNSYESRLNRTTAVGMYPHGATRQGVHDMVGNVEEWCLSDYEEPEQPEAVRIDKKVKQRVILGGSWSLRPGNLRASFRLRGSAGLRDNDIGFRLAQDIP